MPCQWPHPRPNPFCLTKAFLSSAGGAVGRHLGPWPPPPRRQPSRRRRRRGREAGTGQLCRVVDQGRRRRRREQPHPVRARPPQGESRPALGPRESLRHLLQSPTPFLCAFCGRDLSSLARAMPRRVLPTPHAAPLATQPSDTLYHSPATSQWPKQPAFRQPISALRDCHPNNLNLSNGEAPHPFFLILIVCLFEWRHCACPRVRNGAAPFSNPLTEKERASLAVEPPSWLASTLAFSALPFAHPHESSTPIHKHPQSCPPWVTAPTPQLPSFPKTTQRHLFSRLL